MSGDPALAQRLTVYGTMYYLPPDSTRWPEEAEMRQREGWEDQ